AAKLVARAMTEKNDPYRSNRIDERLCDCERPHDGGTFPRHADQSGAGTGAPAGPDADWPHPGGVATPNTLYRHGQGGGKIRPSGVARRPRPVASEGPWPWWGSADSAGTFRARSAPRSCCGSRGRSTATAGPRP